jgi:DNA-binding GntR family transcriptional regulator
MLFQTKEEQIADFLREEILAGRLPRGMRLKQDEVAERLNTSITPVREALKMLKAEGYLSGDSYRGVHVAYFDAEASSEIKELRVLLEGKLVLTAAGKATSQHVRELDRIADEFAAAVANGDRVAVRRLNYRFHYYIYDVASLPQTLHFVRILWARFPFDLIHAIDGRIQAAVLEHADIMSALRKGDAGEALLAMRRHIELGCAALENSHAVEMSAP